MNSLNYNDFFKLGIEQKNIILKNILYAFNDPKKKGNLSAPFNDPNLEFKNLKFNENDVDFYAPTLLTQNMPKENIREIYGIKNVSREDFILNKVDDFSRL